MKPRILSTTAFALALLLAAAAGFSACAGTASITRPHPEEISGLPRCSECHENAYAGLDHDAGYGRSHRFPAARQPLLCTSCHRQSFCADCHANREELKPSDKFQDAPGRAIPHRGDYLTRHRVDGRLNPASCFGCHGRKNDWRCKECHR
jgi:hypothetical protein